MASQRVRVVVKSLEGFIDAVMKKLTLDIVANLRSAPDTGYGTPVDTGWARANWIPQIGSPRTSTEGTREAAELGNVSTAGQEAGLASVVTSYTRERGAIYISNNVPYIVRLNEGSSKQAPKGFVQNAIAKAIRVDLGSGLGAVAAPTSRASGTQRRDSRGRFI
jgi:hypothetical protein